jgi:hypothetical protein
MERGNVCLSSHFGERRTFMVQQHQEIQMLETRLVDRARKTTIALGIGIPVVCGVAEIMMFLTQTLNPAVSALLFLFTSTLFPLVAFWILPWISDIERYKQLVHSQPHEASSYVPGRDD